MPNRNYKQTIDYLFAQLPAFQNLGAKAIKKGLGNSLAISRELGNPEHKFRSIHIAGTNGKGSVSNILASVLGVSGLKVGLYTSPHLVDFRERIRVNGSCISEQKVVDFVQQHQVFIESLKPSFFEITQAMAFAHFAEQQVDIALVETGLGGRLDATNIIQPELSIITNVGFDHTEILGNSLAAIAREKAGIIKPNTPVLIGREQAETKPVFEEIAKQNQAPLHFATPQPLPAQSLLGDYQVENHHTALSALELLPQYSITQEHLRQGLAFVPQNTGLRGRWEVLRNAPVTICDTGHNQDAWTALAKQIAATPAVQKHLVLGFASDKNVAEILALLPADYHYYFCETTTPRCMTLPTIQAYNTHPQANFFASVTEAYRAAQSNANVNDLIFIGGSTFVVADFLKSQE